MTCVQNNFPHDQEFKLEEVTSFKHLGEALCKQGYVIHYVWQSLDV